MKRLFKVEVSIVLKLSLSYFVLINLIKKIVSIPEKNGNKIVLRTLDK